MPLVFFFSVIENMTIMQYCGQSSFSANLRNLERYGLSMQHWRSEADFSNGFSWKTDV